MSKAREKQARNGFGLSRHRSLLNGGWLCRLGMVVLGWAMGGAIIFAHSGCSSSAAIEWKDQWIQDKGGVIQNTSYERLIAACWQPPHGHFEMQVRFYVLDSDSLTAYAWPDGSVYLSRGLVERVDGDLLSAAVAHEIGHLLDKDPLDSVWSLRDFPVALDRESRADRIGCRLLEAQGIPPQVMIKLLETVVQWDELPASNRRQMARRIAMLHDALGTEDIIFKVNGQ